MDRPKADEELVMDCILGTLINQYCFVTLPLHIDKDMAQVANSNITNQSIAWFEQEALKET